MSDVTPEATTVVLLDWQGRLVWVSSENPQTEMGRPADFYVREDFRAKVSEAMTEVVQNRRSQELQVISPLNEHFRVWMWPLDSPDVAVCALCLHIPDSLAKLTSRELDCLKLLAHGWSVGKIAKRLDIAVSTVHTHFRRAREKLDLPSLEALISFAARHCETFPSTINNHGDASGV
ncbi:MAG TPA: helix-turn-helix transcriptional regulator [Lacipirellulaceae bacterium]|nr:helix-turn-helix transcriptional regulator [Lacipirellulaceae bacterium]